MTVNQDVLDELYSEIEGEYSGIPMTELLDFVARFPNMSPYNAALVAQQRPDALYVASARTWMQKYGRSITAGARPLVVLRPFGPVEFVFDIADTRGGRDVPVDVLEPFALAGKIAEDGYLSLLRRLRSSGIRHVEAETGTSPAGTLTCDSGTGVVLADGEYTLVLDRNQDEVTKLVTLFHELAHVFAGHLGPNEKLRIKDPRNALTQDQKEFEAEAIAWLLARRIGLDPRSGSLLADLLASPGGIGEVSRDRVFRAAHTIEEKAGGAIGLGSLVRDSTPALFSAAVL